MKKSFFIGHCCSVRERNGMWSNWRIQEHEDRDNLHNNNYNNCRRTFGSSK